MAPIYLMRKRHIIYRLGICGAITPETAKSLYEAGVFNPGAFPVFTRHMVKKQIIKQTSDGKYYLNQHRK